MLSPSSRERELFIGTQFSNLYTAVDTPARGRVVHSSFLRFSAHGDTENVSAEHDRTARHIPHATFRTTEHDTPQKHATFRTTQKHDRTAETRPLVLGPLNSLVWYVPSLKYTRGLGWRMHCGVDVTESSTNKQHHLSTTIFMHTGRGLGIRSARLVLEIGHRRHAPLLYRFYVNLYRFYTSTSPSSSPCTTASARRCTLMMMMSFICSCRNKKQEPRSIYTH
jgi:hypothetical protein